MPAPTYGDRVQETFTTTGTGTISLGGAVVGYQAFSAVVANAGTCYYGATDGTNWEVGLGTFTAAGNTLARTTVLASSNAGSAVNWLSGTKSIWLDLPAYELIQATGTGALVRTTSPTLVTPALGTPASGNLSNCTGSPTLTAPALGTPASGNLSNCTNVPVGIMTALGVGSIITGGSTSASTAGNTTAASNITPKDCNGNNTGDSITGTWQALTSVGTGSNPRLWQRTA